MDVVSAAVSGDMGDEGAAGNLAAVACAYWYAADADSEWMVDAAGMGAYTYGMEVDTVALECPSGTIGGDADTA